MKKIYIALFALLAVGSTFTACTEEEPFATVTENDDPHILAPVFPDRTNGQLATFANISRDANLSIALTVTPKDYTTVTWFIDGQEVESGTDSDKEINRSLKAGTYNLKIEVESGNGKRDDLIKLRDVLETVGKIYGWEQLGRLFIKSDFPPERRGEFKYYSDSELKRLNAHIVKLEEQIARALIIHQLLGNRISDTLTMRKDCLYRRDNQDMVIIYQPKSRRFEKPVSAEVAQLIKKAIVYAEQNYKESIYIFANKDNPQKPLNYQTLREKVIRMIYENDLRDDQGELFGFGSHLFRHTYGMKLTELHVDDWTISKLIGHKNVKTVKYYRKMSNQSMADETREARNYMSNVILANLDGW